MPERQRVLMVLESLGPGGAELAALNLLTALAERGHVCAVANLWGPDTLAEQFDAAGIPVHCLRVQHRWRVDQGVSRLAKLIRQQRPTVLHAQLFFAGSTWRSPARSPRRQSAW